MSDLTLDTPPPSPRHVRLPPELLSQILHHLAPPPPVAFPSSDPFLNLLPPSPPVYLTPRLSPSPKEAHRHELNGLCVGLGREWGDEARRALWREVEIGMPRAWEGLLRVVEDYGGERVAPLLVRGASLTRDGRGSSQGSASTPRARSIEPPSASTDVVVSPTSEDRGRERVPRRWVGPQSKWAAMAGSPPSSVSPHLTVSPQDSSRSPLLLTRSISFARFRTAGMSRSGTQGTEERFVTPGRLLALLQGTRLSTGELERPGYPVVHGEEEEHERGMLEAVGFTEFMDSAITKAVLEELLFRGGYEAEYSELVDPHQRGADLLSESAQVAPTYAALQPSPSPSGRAEGLRVSFQRRMSSPSQSRSPFRRRPSVSQQRIEEDTEEESALSNAEDDPLRTPKPKQEKPSIPRLAPITTRVARTELQRRSSGSAFDRTAYAARRRAQLSSTDDESEDESRGRDRVGRTRFNASLASINSRSTSVPPVVISEPIVQERASSVPAPGPLAIERRTVRVKEGSKQVTPIVALDLCGVVSKAFVACLADFVSENRLGPPGLIAPTTDQVADEDGAEEESRGRAEQRGPTAYHPGIGGRHLLRVWFPHLSRLGLHGSLLPTPLLTAFVLSFPHLTHLDLGGTLAGPALLHGLAIAGQAKEKPMRLLSLNLARCRLPNGGALVGLLCGDQAPFTTSGDSSVDGGEVGAWGDGAVVKDLMDLCLFGDNSQRSPLSAPELHLILTKCPAVTSGQLRALDFSSAPFTDEILSQDFPPQPRLLELGLAHCRGISLGKVAEFLESKAPRVEVLNLAGSCPAPPGLAGLVSANRRRMTLNHGGMSLMDLHQSLLSRVSSLNPAPHDEPLALAALQRRATHLRVVELDPLTLEGVQGGAGDWKPIFGKGKRGWYVDIGSESNPSRPEKGETGDRTLAPLLPSHPKRAAYKRTTDFPKTVTGVYGWSSRKMEVLRGEGMVGGREDGLYNFHAFSH